MIKLIVIPLVVYCLVSLSLTSSQTPIFKKHTLNACDESGLDPDDKAKKADCILFINKRIGELESYK